MVVTQKRLRKSFALGFLGLYAFGVGFAFNYKTNGEYIRYLHDSVNRMRLTWVAQNEVLEQYNSVDANSPTYVDDHGNNVVPYISYSISHNANSYYSVGEVHFCFIGKEELDHTFDDVYLDYLGQHSYYGRSFTDVGDFQYNNVSYNLVKFLISLSADNVYGYNTLLQYGYNGSIDFDVTYSRLSVAFNFAFKSPSSSTWTTCSLFNATYNNVTYLDEDVNYSFSNYTYLNSVLSFNLNTSINNLSSYQNGINDVINNPSAYGLYTLNEYLAYGTSKYNEGLEDGSNVLSMSGVMNSIFSAPITMFIQIFNSAPFTWTMPTGEILDIGGIMTFFLTIGIALAIVKLIMRVGGK